MPDSRPTRPLTAVGALTTVGGVLLLVWWIRRIGVDDIRAGFAQIGWGLGWIVLLGGVRFALRALAWTLSIEPPDRLRFGEAFRAVVAGDALGNLLPLGPLASEPAKAAFVRRSVPLGPAATALAIENVLYTLSVAATIAAGMAALLFVFEIPWQLREIGELAIAAVALTFGVAVVLLWMRPAVVSRTLALVLPGSASERRIARVRALEDQIYTFASRRGLLMVPIVGAEVLFHALGVLEAYITLWWLLGAQPHLLIAFILEAAGRLLTVVFKFVPLQMGVSEAGTAFLTGVLGLGPTLGTTLGLVRKVRMICWTAVGTMLLVRRGLSASSVLTDTQLNRPLE
jgi:Lysylphosphatidylglycerol synthase TM region